MTILENLVQLAHPQGGWGYIAGQAAHLEPTCLALLALGAEKECFQEPIAAGLRVLEENSLPDGGYRLSRGRPQALWPTPLVLFTRLTLGVNDDRAKQTMNRLLMIQGRVITDDPEVADMMDIDLKKVGWPWALNTFSWVEPTSWACLALRRAGKGTEPRVIEGVRLLLDRAFDQGGINYGNRLILGRMTEPIPTPTALMLLALQGHGNEPRVQAARKYLMDSVASTSDLEHLGWAKLALHAHGDDTAAIDVRIRSSYEANTADGRPMSVVRHALTALALDAGNRNPFRLNEEQAKPLALATVTSFSETREDTSMKPGFLSKIRAKFRGVMVRGLEAMRAPPAFGSVHIAAVDDYEADLHAVLKKQFEHFRPHVPFAGKRIVLKPNLVEWHRDKV
ncbi:MAG: hypothetical protein K8T89_24970, partial [Planctomycetes bacterium]|nr:hypothetical protein [Planctomycetota bacterium]